MWKDVRHCNIQFFKDMTQNVSRNQMTLPFSTTLEDQYFLFRNRNLFFTKEVESNICGKCFLQMYRYVLVSSAWSASHAMFSAISHSAVQLFKGIAQNNAMNTTLYLLYKTSKIRYLYKIRGVHLLYTFGVTWRCKCIQYRCRAVYSFSVCRKQ